MCFLCNHIYLDSVAVLHFRDYSTSADLLLLVQELPLLLYAVTGIPVQSDLAVIAPMPLDAPVTNSILFIIIPPLFDHQPLQNLLLANELTLHIRFSLL